MLLLVVHAPTRLEHELKCRDVARDNQDDFSSDSSLHVLLAVFDLLLVLDRFEFVQ